MKKILLVIVSAFLFLGVMNVEAMTKNDLEDKLTRAYTINGTTFQASSSDIVKIKRYIKQNNISDADASYISNKVDEAINVIERSGVKSLSNLPKSYKDELVRICNDVSNNTAIKVSASKNTISVYNIDGTKFDEFGVGIVKFTGANGIILMTSVVSLIGIIVLAKKNF